MRCIAPVYRPRDAEYTVLVLDELRQARTVAGLRHRAQEVARRRSSLAFLALERGVVQAASLTIPFTLIAKNMGYRELVDYDKAGVVYPYNTITTLRRTPANIPELTERFLKAMIEGTPSADVRPGASRRILHPQGEQPKTGSTPDATHTAQPIDRSFACECWG
jgi:hypothetical protein